MLLTYQELVLCSFQVPNYKRAELSLIFKKLQMPLPLALLLTSDMRNVMRDFQPTGM